MDHEIVWRPAVKGLISTDGESRQRQVVYQISVINGALISLPVCDVIIYLSFIYHSLRWGEGVNSVTVGF